MLPHNVHFPSGASQGYPTTSASTINRTLFLRSGQSFQIISQAYVPSFHRHHKQP